jgi:putative ABC transport system substrate-binding protein
MGWETREKGVNFNIFKNYSIIVFILISVIAISGCTKQKKEELYKIGIVQIVQTPLLDIAREGVIDAMKKAGFIDGKNIKIVYRNAQGEILNINLILQEFVHEKVDLIITNSSPCLVSACNFVEDIPVVSTAAFHPQQLGIKEIPKNVTGTYDPFDMNDFIDLIKEISPDAKKIGVPWNPSESNSRFGKGKNIEIVETSVNSSSEVYTVVQMLVTKGIDVFVVATDNTVTSAFESVVKVAEEEKVPIFTTEPANVYKGACAGLGIDLYDGGFASGRLAVRILKGEKVQDISYQLLTKKSLYLNLSAAKAQGIEFSEEILKRADKVIGDKLY